MFLPQSFSRCSMLRRGFTLTWCPLAVFRFATICLITLSSFLERKRSNSSQKIANVSLACVWETNSCWRTSVFLCSLMWRSFELLKLGAGPGWDWCPPEASKVPQLRQKMWCSWLYWALEEPQSRDEGFRHTGEGQNAAHVCRKLWGCRSGTCWRTNRWQWHQLLSSKSTAGFILGCFALILMLPW